MDADGADALLRGLVTPVDGWCRPWRHHTPWPYGRGACGVCNRLSS